MGRAGPHRTLRTIKKIVDSHRYLSSRGKSAGRHGNHDSLERYIREYPESSFRSLFRMQRASFWQLVEVLTHAGGPEYWCQNDVGRGCPRPIYQQIAAGLYVLGGGGTVLKSRILLNIGH